MLLNLKKKPAYSQTLEKSVTFFVKFAPPPSEPNSSLPCLRCSEPKSEQLPGPHPTSSPTLNQSEFYPLTHSFPP